jgi:hypothetical protein
MYIKYYSTWLPWFSFLCEATDVSAKTTDLAKGQGYIMYFNLQAENTTDSKSISNDNMDRQSVNNENPEIQ